MTLQDLHDRYGRPSSPKCYEGHLGRSTRMLCWAKRAHQFPTHTCMKCKYFSNDLHFRYPFAVTYLQWYQGNLRIQEFLSLQGHLLSRYSHHDPVSPLILAALDDPVEEKKKCLSIHLFLVFLFL